MSKRKEHNTSWINGFVHLVAAGRLTTFLISNSRPRDVMSIPHMYYICPFGGNLARTQWQCGLGSCAPQRRQYAALGFSLQLLQPWVGVSSLPPVQFSWQQKSRRTLECARGSAHCRGLSRRGEHTARHAAQYVSSMCAGIACRYDEFRLWKKPWTVLECRANVLMRSTLISRNGKRDSRRCSLTAIRSQLLNRF